MLRNNNTVTVGRGLAPAVYHLRRIVDIYGFLGRERRPRRSVGFDAFHGQPQGYDFVFSICSGRRPHRSKWFFTLFACGESVRRRRRTLRICREFVRFQPATVEHGSPAPNIIDPVFSERRGRRSLRGKCIDLWHFQSGERSSPLPCYRRVY